MCLWASQVGSVAIANGKHRNEYEALVVGTSAFLDVKLNSGRTGVVHCRLYGDASESQERGSSESEKQIRMIAIHGFGANSTSWRCDGASL